MIYAIKVDSVLCYENIYECSKDLGISGVIISECMLHAQTYNDWQFISEFAVAV